LQIIPIAVRVIPFVAFAALTLLQGKFGVTGQYWIYGFKTVLAALAGLVDAPARFGTEMDYSGPVTRTAGKARTARRTVSSKMRSSIIP
jgi:hypothetical protein